MRKKYKRIIAAVGVILIVAAVLLVSLPSLKPVVVEGGNYGFTTDMMSYLIKAGLESQVKYYSEDFGQNYLDAVSLDADKSLKKQDSPYGGSWFGHFYDIAVEKAKNIILACELADKENISLTADETADCDASAKTASKETGLSYESIKKLMRYTALAEKHKSFYLSKLQKSEYEAYYSDNRKKYDCIDYKCLTVQIDVDKSLNGGDSVQKLTREAESKAKSLLGEIRKRGFDKPAEDYLKEINSTDTIKDLTVLSQKYIEDTPFFDWAFSDERKPGDAEMFEGKYKFSIYCIEKTPYPYDYVLSEGTIAVKNYKEGKSGSLTKLRQKFKEYGDDEKGFEKFIGENGFTRVRSGVLPKEDLRDPVLEWMYSGTRKSGDSYLCIYGEKIYAMRYSGSAGLYFDYALKNDYGQSAYGAALKKAAKDTNIKVKNIYKFLING